MRFSCRSLIACLALVAISPLLAGCFAKAGYFRAEDAPQYIQAGLPDFRLALTYSKGPPVAAFAEKLPHDNGSLGTVASFEHELVSSARPLDVILFRSGISFAKNVFPTFFTHSAIWLGTEQQLRREGLWSLPELAPFRERIQAGFPIAEAAYRDVHLSRFEMTADYDRLMLLRGNNIGLAQKRAAFAKLAELEGRPFDPSFDARDPERLSCIELLSVLLPELELPERYAQGRYTIIPDDAARLSLEGKIPFRFVAHFHAEDGGPLQRASAAETLGLLTSPREKPRYAVY